MANEDKVSGEPVTTIGKESMEGIGPQTKAAVDDLLVEYYGRINSAKYRVKKESGQLDRLYESVGHTATAKTYNEVEKRAIELRIGEAKKDINFELKGEKPEEAKEDEKAEEKEDEDKKKSSKK